MWRWLEKFIDPVVKAAEENNISILQIKEKFGTLRIYHGPSPNWFHTMTTFAEWLSESTCEECGKSGKLRSERGWMKTLCEECND